MKKLSLVFFTFLLLVPCFSIDFEVSLMPQLDFHTESDFDDSFSGMVSLDFYPFVIRLRDKIGISLQGGIAKALRLANQSRRSDFWRGDPLG